MDTRAIWQKYATEVKQFILSKVKSTAIAEDLLQETFIKVHTQRQHLRDAHKLKAWVFSIARYTVIDYFRKNHQSMILPLKEVAEESPISEHTAYDCLEGIIKRLPERYQKPLILSYLKGFKQQEVAEILQLPLSTVKSQIQRGRTLIAEGFMDCCGFKMNPKRHLVGELKDRADCKICRHQIRLK